MSLPEFDEIKVFSTTLARERDQLGETITTWLREHPSMFAVGRDVTQSSDRMHHCVTITLYLKRDPSAPVVPTAPTPVPRIYSFVPDKKKR